MTIFNDTYVPYEFTNKQDCYKYLEARCSGIKRSLRRVEKDTEHLLVRCPVSGDYLDVTGTPDELEWLDNQCHINSLYRA